MTTLHKEPDDKTLDNAGPIGRAFAMSRTTLLTQQIATFDDAKQRAAIARIVANNLYEFAEKIESAAEIPTQCGADLHVPPA